MKHLKTYEILTADGYQLPQDEVELLNDLIDENPLSKTHDFYIFLAHEKFEETENGLYKKTIDIEKMIRITPDAQSVGYMKGLQMRSQFQHDAILYHIWLPQEIRDDVEFKGGDSLEPWLVELINKYKRRGDKDGEGKRVMKDVMQRKEDAKKYNL